MGLWKIIKDTSWALTNEVNLQIATDSGSPVFSELSSKTFNITTPLTFNSNITFTPDGGIAMSMINKTGTTSVKGKIAQVDTGVDNAFDLVAVGGADPIGIIYGDDNGNQVADGISCWIVFGGKAYILFQAATTRHHMARVTVSGDDNNAPGLAISEAVPTSPFSTDKHFQEVGHVTETIGSAGLALCVIHQN